MKSIRSYLVIALLSTVMLGNFVAAVHGYRTSMAEAEALLDSMLVDAASLIEAMLPANSTVTKQPSSGLAFQIWTAGGEIVQRSENTPAAPIGLLEEGFSDENFGGFRWRVRSQFDAQGARWILVAERIDVRVALADSIILRAVLPIVFSLPVIAILVWLVIGHGLSLMTSLAQELRNKRADDLSRLRIADPPQELAPVIDGINDLLRRLDESVQRERRFSADAAHELRTPISAIKVHIHNLQKERPDDAEALQVLNRDLNRLSHLIEQIMLLYRTTPEHYQANMQNLDLRTLASSVIGELYAEIAARQQSISLDAEPQTIVGDEASLVILLRNLIMNASKYSPTGASIQVRIAEEDFGIGLTVSDNGVGIPLTEISRVFDRFYRVGGDRHASAADGCGLGLAIVKHIADLHQAKISMENNADGAGLSVHLVFPFALKTPMVVGRQVA